MDAFANEYSQRDPHAGSLESIIRIELEMIDYEDSKNIFAY